MDEGGREMNEGGRKMDEGRRRMRENYDGGGRWMREGDE